MKDNPLRRIYLIYSTVHLQVSARVETGVNCTTHIKTRTHTGKQIFRYASFFFAHLAYSSLLSASIASPPMPKNCWKNPCSFSMTVCFFLARVPPPPKRETGGISLSMSVPVVLISPSRKAFCKNLRVYGSRSFSSWISCCNAFSRSALT